MEDEGTYGQRLAESLQQENWLSLKFINKEAALKLLRQDKIEAVIVIKNDFTKQLKNGEFSKILELHSTPSSKAAITVSEPVINKTLMLWVEEFARLNIASYLIEHDEEFTAAEEIAFRENLAKMWADGSGIEIKTVYLKGEKQQSSQANDIFTAAIAWYGIFCMFYLLISASWILDINNLPLKMRANQKGVKIWQLTIVSALAPFILAVIGYLLMAFAVCLFYENPLLDIIQYLLPFSFYLLGSIGIMLAITSTLSNLTILLFLAPVITFLCSVLSSLIAPLPEWATVLTMISQTLPGRWLTGVFSGSIGTMFNLIACAIIWLVFGTGISLLKEKTLK